MSIPMITINLDKKCAECGKGGAVGNGICLCCTNKAIMGKPMKSLTGRAVQARWKDQARQLKAELGRR